MPQKTVHPNMRAKGKSFVHIPAPSDMVTFIFEAVTMAEVLLWTPAGSGEWVWRVET